MPTKPLSEEMVRKVRDLRSQGLTYKEVARQAGLSYGAVHKACNSGHPSESPVSNDSTRGQVPVNTPIDNRDECGGETIIVKPDKPLSVEEVAELFKIDLRVWTPLSVKTNQWQGFYKVETGEGHRKVPLWQTSVVWKRVVAPQIEQAIIDTLGQHIRPVAASSMPKSIRRQAVADPQMLVWGLWDAHLGMYAWHSEVGQSYDMDTAVARVCNSVDDIVSEVRDYPITQIVMPIGNDFLHYDNIRQKTTHGDHHLDADGRYAKLFAAALKCLIYMVERAVTVCDKVHVVYVPGNHDLTSSYALCVALSQRYINDERITFDIRANPRKYVAFGGTLLGFDHGQGANARQLSLIFAQECAEHWSKSHYREIQVGHTHQRRVHEFESVIPTNGVTIRTNPALCNTDAWHHTQGLIGEPMKSVEAWRYTTVGYVGSHVAWACDEKTDAIADIKLCRPI